MAEQAETLIPPTLRWTPLPTPLDKGLDRSAPTKLVHVDAERAFPCRRCLKDGKLGEKMLLLSYDPWLGDSPFRQYGPIFVHEQPKCELAKFETGATVAIPDQQRRRLLSVRAFDKHHMMKNADVFRGTDLLHRAEELFENKEVEFLHVHYAFPGCFGVRIDRGEQSIQASVEKNG